MRDFSECKTVLVKVFFLKKMSIPSVPTEHSISQIKGPLEEALRKQLEEKGPDDEYYFQGMVFKLNRQDEIRKLDFSHAFISLL